MRSSKAVVVSIVVLATAITPALAIGNSSVIKEMCASLKLYPSHDYCVSVLSADPAAASAADDRGLATAAINMTAHKAASTLQVITYLIEELNMCRYAYTEMGKELASILADLQAGRFDSQAIRKSESASEGPNDCDIQLFEGNSHKNPISKENGDNNNLARLANAILESIVLKRQRKVVKS